MELLLQPTHAAWAGFARHGASFAAEAAHVQVVHTTAGAWAAPQDALFLHHRQHQPDGAAAGRAAAHGMDVALALGAIGCAVTDAPAGAFEGFRAAARQLGAAASRREPRPFTPASARGWMRSPVGGEALVTYLGVSA